MIAIPALNRSAGVENQPIPERQPDDVSSQNRTAVTETGSAADGPPRGTFELKFLVNEDQAAKVTAWARQHLLPDPHCSAVLGDGYWVNSLYLDTSELDVYHRTPGYRRTKCRIRRYGNDPAVWLEAKRKRAGLVRKRRTPSTSAEFLSHWGGTDLMTWDGEWFQRRLERLNFRPVCQVTYQRMARYGQSAHGPVRLTIDQDLQAIAATDWSVPTQPLQGSALLEQNRIVELKFREAMPTMFRTLIQDCGLQLTAFSKYRTAVEASWPLENLGQLPPFSFTEAHS